MLDSIKNKIINCHTGFNVDTIITTLPIISIIVQKVRISHFESTSININNPDMGLVICEIYDIAKDSAIAGSIQIIYAIFFSVIGMPIIALVPFISGFYHLFKALTLSNFDYFLSQDRQNENLEWNGKTFQV